MTPGARVAAAIEVLGAIDGGGRRADDVAADYFRRRRYIGAGDRGEIAQHIYAVLRHRAALDWWIARQGSDAQGRDAQGSDAQGRDAQGSDAQGRNAVGIGARSRVLAALALIDARKPEAVAAFCDGDRFRPAPLDESEQRLLRGLAGRTLHHPHMPRAVANDLPEWLVPHLEAVFGAALEHEMAALNAPALTDLRVNRLKIDRDGAIAALAAEGVAARPTPWSPLGLRLDHRVPLAGLAAFKKGLIEIQDEASQVAALLADARPGMRVVDFCAGAGGKTLALAAGMENRGKLVACDISARRLERAAQRLRRAGISNVERRVLASERDKWVKRHAGGFDRVFVDAPCLGTGTWRRNPDAKWHASPQDLAELTLRQQDILRSAARLVRPGGRLIYATCSLLGEENEAQAEAFLAAAPDFALYRAAEAWRETLGDSAPGIGDYLRLTPARHGTDGFFAAVFTRAAAAPASNPDPASDPAPDADPDPDPEDHPGDEPR